MGFLIFCCLFGLLLVAAYTVLRTRFRGYTTLELLLKVQQLSLQAGDVPITKLKWSDLCKLNRNLMIWGTVADRYRRVINCCIDDDDRAEMQLTHATFLRKRMAVYRLLLNVIGCYCFGKIARGRCCAKVAGIIRNYTDASLMVMEMAELLGCPFPSP